jgi:hypothetical protein
MVFNYVEADEIIFLLRLVSPPPGLLFSPPSLVLVLSPSPGLLFPPIAFSPSPVPPSKEEEGEREDILRHFAKTGDFKYMSKYMEDRRPAPDMFISGSGGSTAFTGRAE